MSSLRKIIAPVTPATGPTLAQISTTLVRATWSRIDGAATYVLTRDGATVYSGSAFTYDDTGVSAGSFNYRIRGVLADGVTAGGDSPISAITVVAPDTTAPSTPVITATTVSSSVLSIALTTPATDASGILNYDLERSLDGSTGWTAVPGSPVLPANFPYLDTGRSASQTYFYRTRPRDNSPAQNVGSYSANTSATTSAATGGALAHGDLFTVTGSGFGTKSGSAPTMWDTGQTAAGSLMPGWAGWPFACTDTRFNIKNRDFPFASPSGSTITAPHPFTNRMIAGCHGDGSVTAFPAINGNNGLSVAFWNTFAKPGSDFYLVFSYYTRSDPLWNFTQRDTFDNNYKVFGYSYGNDGIYGVNAGAQEHWYIEGKYVGSKTDPGQWGLNDDAFSLQNPDANGYSNVYDTGKSPPPTWPADVTGMTNHMNSGWVKNEVIIKITATAGIGFVKVYDTAKLSMAYRGRTDSYGGTQRCAGPGGYARANGWPTNWRYWADIYMDLQVSNCARFYLTNNATFANSTILEIQPYTAWADGSVTLRCNRGKLSVGTAHLHYRNETAWNANTHQYLGTKTLA